MKLGLSLYIGTQSQDSCLTHLSLHHSAQIHLLLSRVEELLPKH